METSRSFLKRKSFLATGLALVLMGSFAQAQGVSGFAEYYILGQDEQVWKFMNRVVNTEGSTAFPTPNRIQITRAGARATVTTGAAHGFTTGNLITIQGADQPEYNGSFTITSTGANTFTYPVTGTPATPATTTTSINAVRHQTSTLILGDGNIANGRVCDYTKDPRVFPCTGVASHDDLLYPGLPMNLNSDQGMSAPNCGPPYAAVPSLAQVNCSVPINPNVSSLTCAAGTVTVTTATNHNYTTGAVVRVLGASVAAYNTALPSSGFTITATSATTFTYPATCGGAATGLITVALNTVRFDGGDRVFSVGGSLAIAHIEDPGTPLIGGGTELLTRQLVKNAVAYSVPVGEDLFPGSTNAVFQGLKYVALDVVAFDDNTTITITSPNGGGVGTFCPIILSYFYHYGMS